MKIRINGSEISDNLMHHLTIRVERSQQENPQIFQRMCEPLPMSITSRIAAKLLSVLR